MNKTVIPSTDTLQPLGHRFCQGLLALLLLGLVQQTVILSEAWSGNPLASAPILDARAYWTRAGEIAAGQWLEATPFMGAPLYTYFLGITRLLGGGVLAAVIVQVTLHLFTTALLALVAARRFGATAGLLAAALYLLLTESAFYPGRLLACAVHSFLVVALYAALLRAQRTTASRDYAIAGVIAGLNAAANPPMLLAVVLLTPWCLCGSALLRRSWRGPGAFLCGSLVAIAPCTLHNYIVCREFIPISAQAGVTFAQGNNPAAVGVYSPLPGISRDRSAQNPDALRWVRTQENATAGWRDVNSYFFRKGREFLAEHPARAAALIGKKLLWFLCSSVYGDIYLPAVERSEGVSRALALAPLPLAWLLWPAFVVCATFTRSPRRFGPELVLLLVPLLVVLAFFYSPRYRFPAAPLAAVVAAAGFAELTRAKRPRTLAIASVIGAVVGPAVSFAVTTRPGDLHDTVDSWRPFLLQKLANVAVDANQPERAVAFARRAIELNANDPLTFHVLGRALELKNDANGAITAFQRCIELDRGAIESRYRLGELLMRGGRIVEGMAEFDGAVEVAPQNPEAHFRRATALAATGRMAEANASAEHAAELSEQAGQGAAAERYRTRWKQLNQRAKGP